MMEIELPDGTIAEFPDGTAPEIIKGALQRRFGAPSSQAGSWTDPLVQGTTLGFGDEIAGGVGGLMHMARGKPFSEGYKQTRDRARTDLAGFRERNPKTAVGLEIAGALPTAVLPVGQVARGASLGAKVLQGVKAGGIYGGLYGAGAEDGDLADRATQAVKSGAAGAAIGGVIPVASNLAGKAWGATKSAAGAPTTDQLARSSRSLYQQAEKIGLVIEPKSFYGMVDNLVDDLNRAGIDKDIQSQAFAAANRLVKARTTGVAPTLQDMDIFRQVAGGIMKSPDANERRIAGLIVSKIDDFMDRLGPSDVIAGDPKAASTLISGARDLWSRKAKGEIIGEMFEKAKNSAPNFSGSGYENAVRTQFRQLANNTNKLRRFSKVEQAAIKKVARGGPIENTLRMLGKFAPTGIVSSSLSGGTGYMIGGPIGAVALPTVGFAARQGATAMTGRNANLADALVRSGGQLPTRGPQAAGNVEALANALLGTANRAVTPNAMNRRLDVAPAR